jgi:hypothetical protein
MWGLELLIRRRKRGSKRRISQPQQRLTFIFSLFSLEAASHLMQTDAGRFGFRLIY